MSFSILLYFFINAVLAIIGAITLETYPVIVRNTAFGLLGAINTLGGLFGLMVASILLEKTDDNSWFILIFSLPLLISAICCSFVIETRNFDSNSYFDLKFSKN